MNSNKSNQKGFGTIEVLLIVVLVGLLVFVGWRFYANQNKTEPVDSPNTTVEEQNTDEVPEVQSESDLEEAEEFLSDTDIDKQLDTSEIDAALEE